VEFVNRIGSVLRRSDLTIRWGGEEFLVVCRDSKRKDGSFWSRASSKRSAGCRSISATALRCAGPARGLGAVPWSPNRPYAVTLKR